MSLKKLSVSLAVNRMIKRKKGVNIVVVPESGGEPLSLKLTGIRYALGKLFLIVSVVLLVLTALFYGVLIQKMVTSVSIIDERDSLAVIAGQVDNVKKNLLEVDRYISYIRKVSEATGKETVPSLSEFMASDTLIAHFSEKAEADDFSSIPNIKPVSGWISNTYSVTDSHEAIDFAASEGENIRVTADGIVDSVYVDEYLGNVVIIDHLKGYKTLYAHCQSVLTQQGRKVIRGETIALVGNSGKTSSGPHLHYEVFKHGKRIDPADLLMSR